MEDKEHEIKSNFKGDRRNKDHLCDAPHLVLLDVGKAGLAQLL